MSLSGDGVLAPSVGQAAPSAPLLLRKPRDHRNKKPDETEDDEEDTDDNNVNANANPNCHGAGAFGQTVARLPCRRHR